MLSMCDNVVMLCGDRMYVFIYVVVGVAPPQNEDPVPQSGFQTVRGDCRLSSPLGRVGSA